MISITKIKKKIVTTPVGDGYVCNCVEHDPDQYKFIWSCDNEGVNANASDHHQYG